MQAALKALCLQRRFPFLTNRFFIFEAGGAAPLRLPFFVLAGFAGFAGLLPVKTSPSSTMENCSLRS